MSRLNESLCVDDFKIYVIFSQQGMYKHSDGIIGFSPVSLHTALKELFVARLVSEQKINKEIVSFYYLKYPDEASSNVLIGDLDVSFVENGDLGMNYFDIIDLLD